MTHGTGVENHDCPEVRWQLYDTEGPCVNMKPLSYTEGRVFVTDWDVTGVEDIH